MSDTVEETEPIMRRAFVRVISVSFDHGAKWKFDDGESRFQAQIDDEQYVDDVEAGKVMFACGDVLEVDMEVKQVLS